MSALAPIFGFGTDGDVTISANTTDAPIDSACTGTAGSSSLAATNASFAVGQKVSIVQMQGTGTGSKEDNFIAAYTAGTITLKNPLAYTYTSGAQVIVKKQYLSLTFASSAILSAKAWNGITGGYLAYDVRGKISGTGSISGDGLGFRAGVGGTRTSLVSGQSGESELGLGAQTNTSGANATTNGTGGQGGYGQTGGGSGCGGGGGGHAGAGGNSTQVVSPAAGGTTSSDSANGTVLQMGAGGGGGGAAPSHTSPDDIGANGGNGGAVIDIACGGGIYGTVTVSANGSNGSSVVSGGAFECGGGGGGAGGYIAINTPYIASTVTLSVNFGSGAAGDHPVENGGSGAYGKIALGICNASAGFAVVPSFNNNGQQTFCGTVGAIT